MSGSVFRSWDKELLERVPGPKTIGEILVIVVIAQIVFGPMLLRARKRGWWLFDMPHKLAWPSATGAVTSEWGRYPAAGERRELAAGVSW